MKIAYLLPSLKRCGPVNIVISLAEEVHNYHEVTVFYFDDICEIETTVETRRIPLKSIFLNGKNMFCKFDIIHTNMFRPDLAGYFLRFLLPKRIQLISTIHQMIKPDQRDQNNAIRAFVGTSLWHYFLSRHNSVVVLNDLMLGVYSRKYKKVHKVHNGIKYNKKSIAKYQSSDYLYLQKIRQKYTVIGSVSRITQNKGFDQIIRALEFLPDCFFYFVGYGEYGAELEKLARKIGVEERVYFAGKKKFIDPYISNFDAFISCSYYEGIPTNILEAALFSKKIICPRRVPFTEMFNDSHVYFYDYKNINNLVSTIKELKIKKENKEVLLKNHVESNFSPMNMAQNYLKIYNS